jgi:hypothetical protein
MDAGFDPARVTYFAATHTRGKARAFGIHAIDRLKHMYVIGKTGVGKSTMLENMAIQDIQNGEGIIFIDPHGSTAEKLLDFIPEDRVKDVIYFDPSDAEFPLAFNIMEDVGFDQRHNVVSGLMGVFERLWADSWSARMQYILQNTLLALLEYPNTTLIDVNRMLINKEFRNEVVSKITDQVVKSFWVEEFANYGDRYTQEATPAIQNKVGQLVSNPLVRNIIGQPKSSFDLRRAMDERKIVICNLAKGKMGDSNSTMIGAVLVIRTYLAAMSRAKETAGNQRLLPPCYFYVDEFQNVVNKAFANILSESRKYGLGLIIANQFIAQLNEKDTTTVKDAVFGNVGTTVVFKVGPLDAQELEPLFEPTFTVEDMVGLGVGQIYLTLSIDGITSPPFSAQTLPPIDEPPFSFRKQVIQLARDKYATPKAEVEDFIQKRFEAFPLTPAKKTGGSGGASGSSFRPSTSPNALPRTAASYALPRAAEGPGPAAPAVSGQDATPMASPRPALSHISHTHTERMAHETPRARPPLLQSRPPAEVLRASGHLQSRSEPRPPAQPAPSVMYKKAHEEHERLSLKDAIAKATAGMPQTAPQPRPNPIAVTAAAPAEPIQEKASQPVRVGMPQAEIKEASTEEVSTEVLKRLLHDDDHSL